MKSVLLVRVDPAINHQERIEKFEVDQKGNIVAYMNITTQEKRFFHYNSINGLLEKQIYYQTNQIDTFYYQVDVKTKKIRELLFQPTPMGFEYQLIEYFYSFVGMLTDIKKTSGITPTKFNLNEIPDNLKYSSCFVLHENGFIAKVTENEQITLTMYQGYIKSMEIRRRDFSEIWNFEYDVLTKKLVLIDILAEGRPFKIYVTYETW
ncbi:MAG: hypothetical protein N2Z72_00215 [Bacteroidales bacterium]|nr:hypothetical protein [Bacteroidales bacterium]